MQEGARDHEGQTPCACWRTTKHGNRNKGQNSFQDCGKRAAGEGSRPSHMTKSCRCAGGFTACAFFNVNLFPETDHERARTLPEHDVQTKPPGRPLSFKPEGDGLTGQWFIPFSAPLRTLSQFPTVIVNPHKGIRPPFNVNDWMIQGSLPTTHASAFFGVGRPSPGTRSSSQF